jgi:hypothetical protein
MRNWSRLRPEYARRAVPKQYSRELEEAGILQEKQIGLNKLFLNSSFLKLLTQEPNDHKRFGSR